MIMPVMRRLNVASPNSYAMSLTRSGTTISKTLNFFYTKIKAIDIMALLDANSGGLHAVNMITLCTNMIQYYVQAEGIPQYIVMMEDAQKRRNGRACPSPTSNS